ncbi:unnamed protein product [Diatraea saccharalis]|uniref:CBF1-interacting co-repressor CIR N-terminal domain-containing protein n=1 Tax=Diatraea saccharalis TaxID=40085 RepID=A0A9N9QVP4_9NEOP|nr:unnamed protein product [Diatraea saccharalis]
MGGGDLNSKKSWHPNTMKNQERVWKAEQAAAEEKKRISELQRERAEERDRAELNQMIQRSADKYGDNRLNWMYDKPDKKVQEEDYLLGKSIDQNYCREKEEQSTIPAVARRVVGSSMLTSGGDAQVDLARKIREDPLLLVKERERAARAALLNNPLHRRRLADLLRKEQQHRKEKTKKKSKKKEKDLDVMLASKLNALSGQKGIDIAKLLDSEDSSSDSSDDKPVKKKKKVKEQNKKKKSKKSKSKKKYDTSPDSSDVSNNYKHKRKSKTEEKLTDKYNNSKKRKIDNDFSECEKSIEQVRKRISPERDVDRKRSRRHSSDEDETKTQGERNAMRKGREETYNSKRDVERTRECERERDRGLDSRSDYGRRWKPEKPKKGLSDAERASKLAAMAAAGAEREESRGRRVAEQRRADLVDNAGASRPRTNDARTLPESLESRIRSNKHYIQRDRHHMNEHFARR